MIRRGEARFGVIWLLSGTLLVLAALLVLARYPGVFRTGVEYRAVFKSVAGLNKGDEVRYGGLPVGTVTRMDIDPNDPSRIIVAFRIRHGTPIRADTKASITQVGLLGAPYLHLEPGPRMRRRSRWAARFQRSRIRAFRTRCVGSRSSSIARTRCSAAPSDLRVRRR